MELAEQNIFFDISARSKKSALKQIAELAEQINVVTDRKAFYKGLMNREKEVTTGFGNGVAIPHCKIDEVIKPSVLVFKFADAIDWQSLDDQPVKLAISLAVPSADAGTEHLKMLSTISRQLIHEDFRNGLLNSTTKEEIIALFKNV
ncbi:PTS sugar transporter subunit IIA [Scopulibacillus cellulosilyticus]|uniref:PTS sugar transporter subunit IIA n=1 Tax=Scopulibacillus cellulosilyticus TaxID=2665665 RepID=A0ABW2Q1K3_9BACL